MNHIARYQYKVSVIYDNSTYYDTIVETTCFASVEEGMTEALRATLSKIRRLVDGKPVVELKIEYNGSYL